ncbi:MAG: inorganic phosphate transporter [Bacteroidia bacterium]|nr:inorganic phosphate transporter [Bacteroidia bacterium]
MLTDTFSLILLDTGLSTGAMIFLGICLLAVCGFEFVNGFHDTANAVATVIYTNTLRPVVAVVWSGIWNFLGVMVGGIAVAMGIANLLPLADMMAQPLADNIAMVLAILLSAIAWNLYTWYYGIPCSSSHTMIGAMLGAGIAFFYTHGGMGVNWAKAGEIGASLLLSPAFGFSMAVLLMFLLRWLVKNEAIFREPEHDQHPPLWIRGILVLTCTLVSFFHGSNDGQKGVGLIMVVLMAFMPIQFALNSSMDPAQVNVALIQAEEAIKSSAEGNVLTKELTASAELIALLRADFAELHPEDKVQKFNIRKRLQTLVKDLKLALKDPGSIPDPQNRERIRESIAPLQDYTDYAPRWAVLMISLSLGIGTMIGWKRIVVTIGEKIGKSHLTYAQGATAEIIAASTIGLSTGLGLPVSTTHVLSSGVAGTMVASRGVANLQRSTIVNIGLAWVLTLPVTMILAALLYMGFRLFV